MVFRTIIIVSLSLCLAATVTAQQSSVTADAHPIASPASPNVDVKTGDSTATSAFRIFNSTPTELLRVRGDGVIVLGGATGSQWHPTLSRAIEYIDTSIAFGVDTDLHFASNAYSSASGPWRYKTSDPAADYYLNKGGFGWRVAPAGTAESALSWVTAMLLTNAGNLGVGTTAPRSMLHLLRSVPGTVGPELILENNGFSVGDAEAITFAANGLARAQIRSRAEGSPFHGTLEFSTGLTTPLERMRITGDGKVGIGTTSPQANLHVMGIMRLDAIVDANDYPSMLEMWASGAGGTRNRWTTLVGSASGALGVQANSYELYEYPAGSVPMFAAMRLRIQKAAIAAPKPFVIDGAGNVGIGALGPAAALDVVGDILARGNISATGTIFAKYQDVAEWVSATSDMVPGTVVILNPEVNNEVMASSDRYDVRVAGVVSGQPGLLLGEAGESKEQIATTGRVRVRVDATAAPIRIGDLLVTSDKPGRAMRSDAIEIQGRKFHQPGTIIGKALEPLAGGEGEILVLLSLQ